jgi:quercetin dioxygenase-like cupin family protein
MDLSRRDLGLLSLAATTAGTTAAAAGAPLPSKTYRFEDLPVKDNGKNRSRAVLNGETHSGFPIEMHMTELAPGEAPHPPHHHVHEEMIMIHEGTLEVTISGNAVKLGPGSSAYVASNEEHGWKNVGATHALYFVLALGRDKT